MSLTPPLEAVYTDLATAVAAIQLHAKGYRYAFVKVITRLLRALYSCDRAGKYDSKGKDPATDKTKQRKKTATKKCGCLIRVDLRLDDTTSQWIVKVLEGVYNHGPSVAITAYSTHRSAALTPETRALIGTLLQGRALTGRILNTLRVTDSNIPIILKDISNVL
jgi:hypothetical protein